MIDYIGIARKAVECDDMVKLLEGKGEYRCEFYYYGFPPDADVTDWNNLISRGIYALYNEGGYDYIPDIIFLLWSCRKRYNRLGQYFIKRNLCIV